MKIGFFVLALLVVSITVAVAQGVDANAPTKVSRTLIHREELMGRVMADVATGKQALMGLEKMAGLETHQLRKLGQLGRAEREQALNLTAEELGKLTAVGKKQMQSLMGAGPLRASLNGIIVQSHARNFRNRPLSDTDKKTFADKLIDFRASFAAERAAAMAALSRAAGVKEAYLACKNNLTIAANCSEIIVQVFNATKGALLHQVNVLASHTEKILLRYREDEFLPANETEQVIQRLEGVMQELRELSSGVAAADTADELKEQLAEVRGFWREKQGELHLLGTRTLRSKAAEIIRQSQILQQRMERIASVLDGRNISTAALEENITVFEQKLEEARDAYSDSQTAFTAGHTLRQRLLEDGNITEGEKSELGLVVNNARNGAMKAHRLLDEARAILNGVFRSARELLPLGADLERAEKTIPELGETETVTLIVRPEEDV